MITCTACRTAVPTWAAYRDPCPAVPHATHTLTAADIAALRQAAVAAQFAHPRDRLFAPATSDVPVAISYSGGTSSKWLVYAVMRGAIQRPANFSVFFSDTGAEHEWTYEDVERTRRDCEAQGVPFFTCRREQPLDAHLLTIAAGVTRADTPPMWVAKDGGGRGQIAHRCTREFKVAPMRRAQSEWLAASGLPKRVEKWIGFGADEVHRAVKSNAKQDVAWETLNFPAIRMRMTRAKQRAQLESWGVKAPLFSMCTFCPWKTDDRWHATPETQRARAIEVDEAVRDCETIGITDGPVFMSDQLRPLATVFRSAPPIKRQIALFPELGAGCDGGHCFL